METEQRGTKPTVDDGTIDGLVLASATSVGASSLLAVGLSAQLRSQFASGRYFLARCGAQTEEERAENWQIYLRRPLFCCTIHRHQTAADSASAEGSIPDGFDHWNLLLTDSEDPGFQWLHQLVAGDSLNLIGPLGKGFALGPECRNLLILADPQRLPSLLPAMEAVLDRQGRVTVVIRDDQHVGDSGSLLSLLPIAAEVHLTHSTAEWRQILDEVMPWADQIYGTLSPADYAALAEVIRRRRLRLEPGFAQLLVQADLICGTGACLACVVPTARGGLTRACVHGPVLDLCTLTE